MCIEMCSYKLEVHEIVYGAVKSVCTEIKKQDF